MSWVRVEGYTLAQAKESVGAGWGAFLDTVFAAKPEGVVIQQVKEKFGTLRIYYAWDNERVTAAQQRAFNKIVQTACRASGTTCEDCGAPGTLRSPHGWWRTTCAAHTPPDAVVEEDDDG